MEVRKIIFPAAAALLLILTVLLYLKTTGKTVSGASEDELAKAKSEYVRSRIAPSAAPTRLASSKRSSTTVPAPDSPTSPSRFSEPSDQTEKPRSAPIPSPNDDMIRTREPPPDDEPTWQQQLRSVNKLYDRKNYEEARASALELLEKDPVNRRMLRVVVSSSCIMAEPEVAKTYYEKLPERDQTTMRKRCERYGVDDLE